jgi:hypothetical protein
MWISGSTFPNLRSAVLHPNLGLIGGIAIDGSVMVLNQDFEVVIRSTLKKDSPVRVSFHPFKPLIAIECENGFNL